MPWGALNTMHAKTFSATTIGVHARLVEVEVDVSFGLVNFFIVGLPDMAIKESAKRIQSALNNCGFKLPAKKIIVNLAPADLKKEGTFFDLAITLTILLALKTVQLSEQYLQETLFLGELALDGTVRRVKGVLAIAFDAKKMNKKRIILPKENVQEASIIQGRDIIGVTHLTEIIAHLRNEKTIAKAKFLPRKPIEKKENIDFSEIKGQVQAKRALQIAAAGRHNILFIGPPGSGKTMLAKRLQTIMPELSFEEQIETGKIYSVSNKMDTSGIVSERPFRNPHHTISQAGLVGGGSHPQPGEISLAHNGILFLDELTEFKRDTLEVLRQPLESKNVLISRAKQSVEYPAAFVLVAALNPCPCGYWGDLNRDCRCSMSQVNRYLQKLSGPLLDRIDLQVHVQSVGYEMIKENKTKNIYSSKDLKEPVTKAVKTQKNRFQESSKHNSSMTPEEIELHCKLTPQAEATMKQIFKKLSLSMRGYHKLLKVARTIADLSQSECIDVSHLQEAIMYRSLDKHMEKIKQ